MLDAIVHCGGNYASATQYEVLALTEKRVKVKMYTWRDKLSLLSSQTIINITSNLRELEVSNKVKKILDNTKKV